MIETYSTDYEENKEKLTSDDIYLFCDEYSDFISRIPEDIWTEWLDKEDQDTILETHETFLFMAEELEKRGK